MKKTFMTLSLLTLSLAATSAFAESAAEEKAKESAIEKAIVEQTAQASYRLPENSNRSPVFRWGYFDTGLVLGSLESFEEGGVIINSWEVVINEGDAGKKSSYAGPSETYHTMPFAYSTLKKDVWEELSRTQLGKPFVFKYRWNLINLKIRKRTNYNIVDVYPAYTDLSPADAKLPLQWTADGRLFFKRRKNVRSVGRIIKVQRRGIFYTGCVLTLHKKGAQRLGNVSQESNSNADFENYKKTGSYGNNNASYVETNMNVEKYVINEDGCRYAESLLPFASIVEIVSDHSYTSVTDYPALVYSISVQ